MGDDIRGVLFAHLAHDARGVRLQLAHSDGRASGRPAPHLLDVVTHATTSYYGWVGRVKPPARERSDTSTPGASPVRPPRAGRGRDPGFLPRRWCGPRSGGRSPAWSPRAS